VAASLAAEIKQAFGAEVELVRSKGGAFEVLRDGQIVFSKLAEHRFPEEGEVVNALRAAP
jgi:selT/selW/selH-like putative selenoprotein